MEIVVPILGLKDDQNKLSDILVLEQFGLKEISKVDFNYISFPIIAEEISNLLHVISCIFYKKTGVCVKANFEFPAVTNPKVFEGQRELTSMGLGLITKLFYDYFNLNMDENSGEEAIDILCVTGVLDQNPSKDRILRGDFLTNTTDKIDEKLRFFIKYVKNNNLDVKRSAFIYCGEEEEESLRNIARDHNFAAIVIKKYSNFDELADYLFGGIYTKNIIQLDSKHRFFKRFFLSAGIVALCSFTLFLASPLLHEKQKIDPIRKEVVNTNNSIEPEKKETPKSQPQLQVIPVIAQQKPKQGWPEEAIIKECRYIENCSFTEYAANNFAVTPGSDAYGCFNNVRINEKGPDWVIPEGGAVGAIGLMRGAIELKKRGYDITEFDSVLRKFFWNWTAGKAPGEAQCKDSLDRDYGAWALEVFYSETGKYKGIKEWNSGATAYMLVAMWKYYEYNLDTGQAATASDWLEHAWSGVERAADFLCRMYNLTYKLVQSHGTYTDMWTGDSSVACAALKCADRWADSGNKPKKYGYLGYSNKIADGLRDMADPGAWKIFYRVRRTTGTKEYAEGIDQICFMPFETDALSPADINNYAKRLSDWWTDPDMNVSFRMTFETDDPGDWRYWGTHWKHYFSDNEENRQLRPSYGFRLAKVEWKYGNATGDNAYVERAAKRLKWGSDPAYSGLWFGADGRSEAGVKNGIVNWRDERDYQKTDSPGARIIDTSSYFIQLCAMVYYSVDTKLIPVR
jgi:hypothetical protein